MASPDSNEFFTSVGSGYQWNVDSLSITPTVRFDYINFFLDGFTESMSNPTAAGGGLGLRVADENFQSLSSNLGILLNYHLGTQIGVITPQVQVEWVHEFLDNSKVISARYANDLSGSSNFNLRTQSPDRDYLSLQLGVSAQLAEGRSGFLSFSKTFARQGITDYSLTAGLRAEF